jgi:spore coat assembly protein
MNSLDSYRNSRYYIQCVREARKYEPSYDKLCIFSGACQSYFEGIMDAGANFASSPGRVLIHALDPAKVGDRIALTDSRVYVSPEQIARLTQSGSKGIGGVKTKGHYIVQ